VVKTVPLLKVGGRWY